MRNAHTEAHSHGKQETQERFSPLPLPGDHRPVPHGSLQPQVQEMPEQVGNEGKKCNNLNNILSHIVIFL